MVDHDLHDAVCKRRRVGHRVVGTRNAPDLDISLDRFRRDGLDRHRLIGRLSEHFAAAEGDFVRGERELARGDAAIIRVRTVVLGARRARACAPPSAHAAMATTGVSHAATPSVGARRFFPAAISSFALRPPLSQAPAEPVRGEPRPSRQSRACLKGSLRARECRYASSCVTLMCFVLLRVGASAPPPSGYTASCPREAPQRQRTSCPEDRP